MVQRTRTDGLSALPHGSRSTFINHKCRCEPCRVADREYMRAYYATHPRPPEKSRNAILRAHDLTRAKYDDLNSAQGGLCAICRQPSPVSLCVDHDHKTGARRGLLCRNCNLSLGYMGDDAERLRAAARYLDAHSL